VLWRGRIRGNGWKLSSRGGCGKELLWLILGMGWEVIKTKKMEKCC